MADPREPVGGIKRGKTEDISTNESAENARTERESPETSKQDKETRKQEFIELPKNILTRLRNMDMQSPVRVFLRGLGRTLQDRRESHNRSIEHERGPNSRHEVNRSDNASHEIKDGKLHHSKEKQYENYLGERKFHDLKRQLAPQQKEEAKQISEFEKALVERFELAKKLEQELKQGKIEFAQKTVEQWRDFFAKFADRTAGKRADLADIELLFRGVVKKGDSKAVMISDIIHSSGGTDKFARFSVIYQKLSALLANLKPGDKISGKALAEGLTSEELFYLALTPPTIETDIFTEMKPKQGMFANESTEARVAEELGIDRSKMGPAKADLQQELIAKMKQRKKSGGFMKWLTGDDEVPLDETPQFIPWWRWGNLNKPGGLKVKRAFYTAVFIIFVLVILFLIDRYLLGR